MSTTQKDLLFALETLLSKIRGSFSSEVYVSLIIQAGDKDHASIYLSDRTPDQLIESIENMQGKDLVQGYTEDLWD